MTRTALNALWYAQLFKTADNLTDRQIDGLETIKAVVIICYA
jgi:hypothetical protein